MISYEGKMLEYLKMPDRKEVEKALLKSLFRHSGVFDINKKVKKSLKETKLRNRGFRQAVIDAYEYRCAVCGMKINSPDTLKWEVEAAHIVPHSLNGKDEILNAMALCRLHHWAFDVGWFTLRNNYTILISSKIKTLSDSFGIVRCYDFLRELASNNAKIRLSEREQIYSHQNALEWHRTNIFHQ